MKAAFFSLFLIAAVPAFAEVHHAQGEMSGEVTATSVWL
jgi:hypothetical protein